MSRKYRNKRSAFMDDFEAIFYNKTEGVWFDYNLAEKQQHFCKYNSSDSSCFYPAIAVPLFANCYKDVDQVKADRLYDFMKVIFYVKNFYVFMRIRNIDSFSSKL